jgi:hypothetical protein
MNEKIMAAKLHWIENGIQETQTRSTGEIAFNGQPKLIKN